MAKDKSKGKIQVSTQRATGRAPTKHHNSSVMKPAMRSSKSEEKRRDRARKKAEQKDFKKMIDAHVARQLHPMRLRLARVQRDFAEFKRGLRQLCDSDDDDVADSEGEGETDLDSEDEERGDGGTVDEEPELQD